MMRTRVIRPGLVTNEDLSSLGLEAEALFIRLWMLADREGRLEDRPAKIRAEVFPYYSWATVGVVEKLLKSLCKFGFINRYKARSLDGVTELSLIEVVNFKKHQWVHAHERPSVLPPCPQVPKNKEAKKPNVRTDSGNVYTSPDMSSNVALVTSNLVTNNGGERAREAEISTTPEDDPPSPPSEKRKTERKPPAKERTPPAERPRSKTAAVDWFPHSEETVAYVRESIRQLAVCLHRPEPDDEILRRVLDVSNGATGEHITEVVKGLYHERKFDSMRTWAFLPIVLAPWFQTRRAG